MKVLVRSFYHFLFSLLSFRAGSTLAGGALAFRAGAALTFGALTVLADGAGGALAVLTLRARRASTGLTSGTGTLASGALAGGTLATRSAALLVGELLAGFSLTLLQPLGLTASLTADDTVANAEVVDGVVGFGLRAEEARDAEDAGGTGVETVFVDITDGDLDGTVVVGGDEAVRGVALAGDVEIDVLAVFVDSSDGGHFFGFFFL